MEQFWIVASFVSLGYAALVTTSLVLVYAFMTRFEQSQVGRQFMLTKMSLALILDYWAIIAFFIRPTIHYVTTMPVRTIICALVGSIMLRWLVILVRAQREVRRRPGHPVWDAPEEPPPVRREQ